MKEESDRLYREFLNSWQEMLAPSGKEIYFDGIIEGQKSRYDEIQRFRDALDKIKRRCDAGSFDEWSLKAIASIAKEALTGIDE